MKKLILFDFDGVLFDSEKNMQLSWNAVMKKFFIKKNFAYYKKFIGLPFKKILLNLDIKSRHKEIEEYYQKNSIKYLNMIKPYPGVIKTLERQKNKRVLLGIWTSKHKKRVDKILKKYDLRFDIILTPQKKIRGKPYPDQVKKCLKKLKLLNKYVTFVGDMKSDKIAAKNANINFIFASYGFGKLKEKNIINVKKFEQIFKIIKI